MVSSSVPESSSVPALRFHRTCARTGPSDLDVLQISKPIDVNDQVLFLHYLCWMQRIFLTYVESSNRKRLASIARLND